eukprot:4411746-Pleurochrysis_carterae.AAC.1
MRISPAPLSGGSGAQSTPSARRSTTAHWPSGRATSPRRIARLHVIGSIANVKKWKGRAQQKCAVCKKLVTHCCIYCSAEPVTVSILPLHTEKYHNKGILWFCISASPSTRRKSASTRA